MHLHQRTQDIIRFELPFTLSVTMTLPTEITVLKGSKQGVAVASKVPGRTTLQPNEVALQVTHSGVGFLSNPMTKYCRTSTDRINRFVEQTYITSMMTWSSATKVLVLLKQLEMQSRNSKCA
jgi:hypothetical protein